MCNLYNCSSDQEGDKHVELEDFSQKKRAVELEGDQPVDRDGIFEPRSEEDCEQEESKEIREPKEMLISEINGDQEESKEIRDPKELLISEINDMQKTLKDLMDKAGRVHGDVQRLESENEVKSVHFAKILFFLGQTKLLQLDQTSRC